MEKLSLKAQIRELSNKDLEAARKEGKIPAVVYGRGFENQHLFINDKEYNKIYSQAGESTIINLKIEDKDALGVIIQDQQKDPLTSEPTHIDFYQVRMDEEIETEIELKFVGEPKAVKELGGILVKSRSSINVKCLPGDLVKEIKVNVVELATFDDVMRIKDLDIPEKIEVLDDLNLTIALVNAPRTDAEIEALDEKFEEDVSKIEVDGAKEEEGEAVEGEDGEKKEGDKEEAKEESKDNKKDDKKEKK